MNSSVPFVDLGLQHERVAQAVSDGFAQVLDTTSFVLGPAVKAFEQAYAEYCGVRHCVGVGNGTDAIEIALRALDIGPGDEVITAANTFLATAEAIVRTGADLVLVDCDENFLLDPAALADALTPRTRAVVPVHLYGQMAPMSAIRKAVGPDVVIIEDAAQAQGASQDGRRAGSGGDAAATSFYPGKNLGAYGDAGAVTTNRDDIAHRMRALRNHGGIAKYEHLEVGVNSRLDSLQAVVLSAKLALLDAWNWERRNAAELYTKTLSDLNGVITPEVAPGNEHVWHLYVMRMPERDRMLQHLESRGIGTGVHYPAPVHLLRAFEHLGLGVGSFPVAERMSAQILSLPIFPGITSDQQYRVVDAVCTAY